MLFCLCIALPSNAMLRISKTFQGLRSFANPRFSLTPKLRFNALSINYPRLTTNFKYKFQWHGNKKNNPHFKFPKNFSVLAGTGIALAALSNDSKHADEKAAAQVQPTRINDSLYVGKVNDKFYVAMERLTKDNADMWFEYSCSQVDKWWQSVMRLKTRTGTSQQEFSLDAATFFKNIIYAYRSGRINGNNEIWIAYASNIPVLQPAKLDKETNPHIEMHVSVATSPQALITSHLGISRTYETTQALETNPNYPKHRDQSIHLHSFAAKVMRMRDSRKTYMLTFPSKIMREILLKKIHPHSIIAPNPDNKVIAPDFTFTLQIPQKKLVTCNPDNSNYEWLFKTCYAQFTRNINSSEYVLIDLHTLGDATLLKPE